MTRINVVPVSCLTDKHLLAEYKEITRPFNKVIARIQKGTMGEVKIPEKYCLGAGHETFFFDKLSWLMDRYQCLKRELDFRRFKVNHDQFWDIVESLEDTLEETPYWGDYTPTPEDIYLNFSRLCKNSNIESVLNELNREE